MTTDKPTCCEKCAGVPYSGQSFKDIPTRLSCIVCPCHKPTEPEKWHCTRCNADWVNDGRWPHLCKPTEPSVCGVAEYDTEGAPFICQNSKPCPLHEPSEVKMRCGHPTCNASADERPHLKADCANSVQCCHDMSSTPQQEKASSWEERLTALVELHSDRDYLYSEENHPKEDVEAALADILSYVRTLIAQAEKRGEVRAYDKMEKMIDSAEVIATHPLSEPDDVLRAKLTNEVLMPDVKKELKDRLTALKKPTQ